MSASLPLDHTPPDRYRWLRLAAAALALGGLGYLLAAGWPVLFPVAEYAAAAPPACDLQRGPCSARIDAAHAIDLEIEPKVITPVQPVRLFVNLHGIDADRVEVEFSGVEMNMGRISDELLDTGSGSFTGDATLPICVRRQMSWQALITAHAADGRYRGTFRFEVNRP